MDSQQLFDSEIFSMMEFFDAGPVFARQLYGKRHAVSSGPDERGDA